MKTWTVQCTFAAYYANTVVVQAPTLEAALEKAIEEANGDMGWRSLDDSGPTFVDAVAEGDVWDPWDGLQSSLPVPARFTERGEPPAVTVIVQFGSVQAVRTEHGPVRVEVRDYDVEGADAADLATDEKGARYARSLWSEFPQDADQER
ncbi:MAG: hypothetical protein KGJ66_10590 [Alphaproteobacteria bacterium]|nr:hypothetical protein [Alphaproteobacteria bacterium]